MACVYPIDAWRAKRLNSNGKREVVFNIRDGYADMPLQLPCGKCIGCTTDRAKVWSIRIHHESTQHIQNSFVTLTYADPPPDAIDKRHVQLFLKRLRRKYSPLRYFACGEYGETSHRPHYHAIIFGHDFLGGAYDVGSQLYSNPYVDQAWGLGHVSIGSVTPASCAYVAGYVNKKIADLDTFNLMSRRPGIGHTWLEKYRDDIIRTETVVIDGREYPVPKKYLDWHSDFDEIKKARAQYMRDMPPEEKHRRSIQLKAKEANLKAKHNLRTEKI